MKPYNFHIIAYVIASLLWAVPVQAEPTEAELRLVATASNGIVRIAGRVSDASGEGVEAAMVKGKSGKKVEAYALTDEDGRYELKVPDALMAGGTVEISSMGFATLTLPLADLAKQPDVVLDQSVSELADFTVKGKGTKVRRPDWLKNAVIYEANLR